MTALKLLSYQFVTASLRLIAEVLGLGQFGGTVEPPQMPPQGLVAEYTFETNANSTASVVVGEAPPRFHHGTLQGNATITAPGIVGAGKLSLDGTGDFVQIAGHADLAPASQFVVFAKIRPTACAGRQELYSAGDSIGFFVDETCRLAGFYFNGSSWIEAKTTLPVSIPGQVAHVAFGKSQEAVGQSDGLRLWVQGAQAHFMPTTGTISYTLGPNVIIGAHGNGGGSYFAGEIDSVRFYANVPPTQDGVTNDFSEQVPVAGLTMTHTHFTQAHAPEGTFLSSLDSDLSQRDNVPFGIRVAIEDARAAGSTALTEFFPLYCCKLPGCETATNWHEITNNTAALGINILNPDNAVNMGDSTQIRLPRGSMRAVQGRIVADVVDKNQKTTLAPGDHTEWEYRLRPRAPAQAGDQYQCRPHRQNGAPMDEYANVKTITLTPAVGAMSLQGGRVGGIRQ
jgi:hypothetical protein